MRLEYLCDFEGVFTSKPVMVAPYSAREGAGYAEGEGRFTGERLSGSARWSNFPRRRADGAMLPDMRGVITTPEGAPILFVIEGLTLWVGAPDASVGSQLFHLTFTAEDERYAWLNNAVCVMEGKLDATIAPGRGNLGAAHIYRLVNELVS